MTPTTSAVIVNFNAGALLVECVDALLASTDPVQAIVVDNASADDSLALLEERFGGDGRLTVLRNDENLGFARATNRGLAGARGEYFLLLNPDCIVSPATVAEVRAALEQHPEAGMAGCLVLNPDGTEQAGARRAVPTPWRAFVRAFGLSARLPHHQRLFDDFVLAGQPLPAGPTPVEAISGAFMMVRRDAVAEIGPLDEGYFLHCEDLDWCMRFRQSGRA
ncbi:MAG TPA: glycosyltransferase family 2 protein, partial [Vicinamibacteria bacterium]|nr:glycosyltransferase family 2 protein [Vicinamibacteria bacterium]